MRNALFAAVAACSLASPAAAAEIVGNYTFTGDNFVQVSGAPGGVPASSFSGSFSYTYDTTTSAFTLTSFDGTVGSQHFTSGLASVVNGAVTIYGAPYGQAVIGSDFVLNMTFDNSNGLVGNLYQLQYGTADFHSYQANNDSVTAVPEPATWAMMLFGFGGIGFVMRRSRKQDRRLLQVA